MESQKYKKLILLDSSSELQNFDRLMNHNEFIITFDYESHNLLSQNNIKHTISDTYLTVNEISMLQENSYRFSRFFNSEKVAKLMNYGGVQLGSLFYIELYVFLLPFLKKFFEIKKICEQNPSASFIVSPGLVNIIKLFTNDAIQLNIKSQKPEFLYDNITLNFKIKNSSFNVKIPNKYYNFIKNVSDAISYMLVPHRGSAKTKEFALLVEFDTLKYKPLLEKNDNFLIYNRRRPTIWNIKSYDVIRKSQSYVVTNSSLGIKEGDSRAVNATSDQIVESLLKNENFLLEFFSLDGISFWRALKPHFIKLCKKRFTDAIKEINMAEQLFKKFYIKSVLVWSENGFNELIIIQLANKYRIPTILIQHGLYYDTLKAKELNEFQGVFPVLSDKFAVWGKLTESYALKCGIPQHKIILAGNPAFDELFENKHKDIDNDYVLLATQSPTNASINDLTIDIIKKYEDIIKKTCEIVTKLNKKLIIKLHPDPYEFDITSLVNKTNKSIKVLKKGNVQDLIKNCELFIAIDISTTILEAQILEKPTISIAVKDYLVDEDCCTIFTSKSCMRTRIEDLESLLCRILSDEGFKSRLIQNGNEYVNQYLHNQGTASKVLSDKVMNVH